MGPRGREIVNINFRWNPKWRTVPNQTYWNRTNSAPAHGLFDFAKIWYSVWSHHRRCTHKRSRSKGQRSRSQRDVRISSKTLC